MTAAPAGPGRAVGSPRTRTPQRARHAGAVLRPWGDRDGSRRARRDGERPGRAGWRGAVREFVVVVVVALVLSTVGQAFVAKVFVIPSASMEPTLQGCSGCANDRVLVDRLAYVLGGDPAPGDVVVFRGPPEWTGGAAAPEQDFAKRVVATGGATVRCCDDRGRVVVDDRPLDEPYLAPVAAGAPPESFGPVRVPDGHLWLMGDNRGNSADSRFSGPVPADAVLGRVRWILLPLPRFGPVPGG